MCEKAKCIKCGEKWGVSQPQTDFTCVYCRIKEMPELINEVI